MKLDKSTVIGLIICWGMIAFGALAACSYDVVKIFNMYINQPDSAAITIGGSVGATFACYPLFKLKRVKQFVVRAFKNDAKMIDFEGLIEELVGYATEARRNGVLALDAKTADIQDPFMKNGIQLAVDGTAPEQISEVLTSDIEAMLDRHETNQAMVLKYAELSPAFGMIGTLLGLIAMLGNLSDSASLGPAFSVAMITTLYGCVCANMIGVPIATKLQQLTKLEAMRKQMIIAAILSIQNGDNPRIVQQKLMSFVTQDIRESIKAKTPEG